MVGPETRLGIVTGRHAPELSDDGQRLAEILADQGIDSEPVIWTDPPSSWVDYDAVLFRSCWDYPSDVPRFRGLLDELADAPVAVHNPLDVIRWNLDKRYLLDLQEAGVRVPATATVRRGSEKTLEAVLRERDWEVAVVKPAVGAMSRRVWRTSAVRASDHEDRFASLLADQDVLVQAFVPQIADGERSAVFFGGEFSHAWNSLPEPDDVTSFDGIDAGYTPADSVRDQAAAALASARDVLGVEPNALPYGRVDYVERDGEIVLLELELIEPFLGLSRGTDAVDRFCEALVAAIDRDGEEADHDVPTGP